MKAVGERIKQARQFRGMSGQELAEKVGYKTQSGIANLENRSNGSGGHALAKIAEVLNFSLEWFLTGPDTDDMGTVAPYGSRPSVEKGTLNQIQERDDAAYDSPTMRAHRLINATSDIGLLTVIDILEVLAQRYPRDTATSAGLPFPAPSKEAA